MVNFRALWYRFKKKPVKTALLVFLVIFVLREFSKKSAQKHGSIAKDPAHRKVKNFGLGLIIFWLEIFLG